MTTRDAPARPRGRPRTTRYSGKYEVLGDVELEAAEHAEAKRQIDQADSERVDVSVTFRWGQQQLDIVRRAARLAGIPYQTYLKGAVMRCAIDDLRGAREAGIELPEMSISRRTGVPENAASESGDAPRLSTESTEDLGDSPLFRRIRREPL